MPEINKTGAVAIAGQLYEYVDILGSKMFSTKSSGDGETFQKKSVHQFALSIGIAGGFNLPKADWEEVAEPKLPTSPKPIPDTNPGSQLATHENIDAILQLIVASGNEANAQTVSEYINGGLQWLKEIGYETQTEESLDLFFATFPHIKGEGEAGDIGGEDGNGEAGDQ